MIETERLRLRKYTPDDFDALYELLSDPETMQHYPAPFDEERTRNWIRWNLDNYEKYGFGLWAVELKETGVAIGAMGYGPSCDCKLPARDNEPIIGYWIAKPYWNRGICTEALGLMVEHIRCMTDIRSLISGHYVDNPASGRVMQKCGFVPTGETVIDETQYQGADRPIRVLRLEIR